MRLNLKTIMTALSALLIVTVCTTQSQAQCIFCLVTATSTCDQLTGCDSGSGCQTQDFNVSCTGQYCLAVVTTCDSTAICSDVRSCVTVTDSQGNVVMRGKSQCDPGVCDWDICYGSGTAILNVNETYTIQVCMQPCNQYTNCNDLPNCSASAVVYNSSHLPFCKP